MVSFETKYVAHCEACGNITTIGGADGTTMSTYTAEHKKCEDLYEALLKFMHIGPVTANLDHTLQMIKNKAYKEFKDSNKTKSQEVDYDKFYR